MIGRLRGVVARKAWPTVLLDVGGVGYELSVPLATYELLPGGGSEATLEVLTVVRSESLQLYGFASRDDRLLFETLLGVSGVGPRLGLAVLSGVSTAALVAAVREDDA
ncbi:MAG: Holliday junction branch migration protein RuvA, partial [Acidobacteriota bacterium]|nr:Holliday junction branch migration protein RuvA [Acidobacteriota bacterium]